MKKLAALTLALCLVLALAACGAAPAGSGEPAGGGEPAAQDADGMMKLATTNLEEAESMSYTLKMELEMSMMGETMAMTMDGHASMQQDPLKMHMVMDMEALGQTQPIEVYAEQEGDLVTMYTSYDGQWSEQSMDISEFEDASAQAGNVDTSSYLTGLEGLSITGEETVAGVACQKIKGTLNGENAEAALSQGGAMDSLGQLGIDPSTLAESLNVPVTVWISKDGTNVMRMELEMTETMNTLMEAMLASADTGDVDVSSLGFSVSKYSMVMEYSDYNSVADITRPAGIAA